MQCVNLVGSQSLLAGHTVIHVHCILLLLFYGTCTHQIVLTQHPPKGYQSWTGPVPSLVVGGTSHHEPTIQPACRAIGHHASLGPAPGPEASPWVSPWASPSCGTFGPPQNHPILKFFHTGPISAESESINCNIFTLFAQSSSRNSPFKFFISG